MSLKSKFIILIFSILLLAYGQNALALELNYPPIPGAPRITGDSSLVDYIQYFFILSLATAGGIAVIIIAVAGFQIILNFGRPETIGRARTRILDAIFGITLLMSSFIILRTINTELIRPTTITTTVQRGVYLINDDNTAYIDSPISISNTKDSRLLDPKYTKLFYYCPPGDPGGSILVWLYNKENFIIDRQNNGSASVRTVELKCGNWPDNSNTIGIKNPVLSYKRDYKNTGVYFFLKPNCQGVSSCYGLGNCAQRVSSAVAEFDHSFDINDRVASVAIVNGIEKSQRYGVVLRQSVNGQCTNPYINKDPVTICVNINQTISPYASSNAVEILNINTEPYDLDSVTLYSTYLYVTIAGGDIKNEVNYDFHIDDVDKFLHDNGTQLYSDIKPPDDECTGVDTDGEAVKTCLDYVEPDGNFYTILYSQSQAIATNGSCQVFNGSINVSNGDISDLLSKDRKLSGMDIIPQW